MSDPKRVEDWLRDDVAQGWEWEDGGTDMAEDAAAFMAEVDALRAKWDAIPMDALRFCVITAIRVAWIHDDDAGNDELNRARSWVNDNAPKDAEE